MEGRRERVALIERLLDTATGLGQARVIYRDAHQLSGTVSQGPFEDGSKQLLRLPLTTRMQKILRAPTAILAAVGPDDARQATPAQTHQGTESLADRAQEGALLREYGAPVPGNGEECGQQGHRASGRRAKVFFSGRRNRSPRTTFLVSEETRLSRSTAMPNWAWMRSRIWETCRGERAFLSMSKAISTCDRPLRRRGSAGGCGPWRRRRTARSWASREASNTVRITSLRSSFMGVS